MPTFTRVMGDDFSSADALITLLKHYNWNHVVLIHNKYSLIEGKNPSLLLVADVKRVCWSPCSA